MKREQAHAEITHLRATGHNDDTIRSLLGLTKSAFKNIINDPDGSKQRARRERYRGTCEDCGAKTDGSAGYGKAPRHCSTCAANHIHNKVWTQEKIIEAIQTWAAEHNGIPPTATDWFKPNRGERFPATNVIVCGPEFPTWADAIEAAGFARPYRGHNLYAKQRQLAA